MTLGDRLDVRTEYSYRAMPAEVIVGTDAIADLREHVARLRSERVMLVYGPGVAAAPGLIDRLEAVLGDRLIGRFDGVRPHAPLDVVGAAHDVAVQLRPDVLLSVGGGSTVDTTKGVALLLATDGRPRSLRAFRSNRHPDVVATPRPSVPAVPVKVMAIGTTMGCAELSRSGGGFYDEEKAEKLLVAADGATSPSLVLIDGQALASTPDHVQRATAMGQVRVAVETLMSRHHTPIGDALALRSLALFQQLFSSGWHSDVSYLLAVKSAAMLAHLAFLAVGSLGVGTAITHHLGALHNASHGETNAALLPHVVRFNSDAIAPVRLGEIATALGRSSQADRDTTATIVSRLDDMLVQLDLPRRLRDLRIAESEFDQAARAAIQDHHIGANPRAVQDPEDLISILRSAW